MQLTLLWIYIAYVFKETKFYNHPLTNRCENVHILRFGLNCASARQPGTLSRDHPSHLPLHSRYLLIIANNPKGHPKLPCAGSRQNSASALDRLVVT